MITFVKPKMAFKTMCNLGLKRFLQTRKFSNEVNKLVSLKLNSQTGIATMEMNRAPVNSFNLDLVQNISASLVECKKQKCRGLIITSSLNTVFCAGLDLNELSEPNPKRLKLFWRAMQDMAIQLYDSPYPTVAAINGHAPAGGCLLSLCCDYRIMRKNFTIGLNEVIVGVLVPFWISDFMINAIGRRQAELALTLGRIFTTDEAFNIKLVDDVADNKEEIMVKAESYIGKFSKISPLAYVATKENLRKETLNKFLKGQEEDLNVFVSFVMQEKVQKTISDYLEALKKRKGQS